MAQSVFVGWFGSIKMESSASGTIFPVTSIFRDGATDILTVSSTAVTSTVPYVGPNGSATGAKSFGFSSETNSGLRYVASQIWTASTVDVDALGFGNGRIILPAANSIQWTSGAITDSSDVSLSRLAADVIAPGAGDAYGLASKAFINTAPTVTSAGTSPSVTASNGTAAYRVNVGTGGVATTIVMAMPAATTGWNCFAENITATAANRANQRVVVQSSTTTSITVQNQTISTGAALAFTASDTVAFICTAY